ncbi:hypothetical protein IAR55_004596 [Kwoniella newhampshirensis]|uniref:Methyltransferase type 11 domain-containing protein n=1 Tax=Kwoniella newhampshirensis TaxID=1651941 RepID=A0AAW0YPX1_9TREE
MRNQNSCYVDHHHNQHHHHPHDGDHQHAHPQSHEHAHHDHQLQQQQMSETHEHQVDNRNMHQHQHQHDQSYEHQHEQHERRPQPLDGHQHDAWSGEDYMLRPGTKETAVRSAESVVYALTSAGVTEKEMGEMDVLEIGCGPGSVTPHLEPHFSTIHSIDTSPSMLVAFSQNVPSSPKLTHSLHALSSSSATTFSSGQPQSSPTKDEPNREIVPPKQRFDLALANLVVHHVDDRESFMQGVVGLVKSGGWVVFTEFGREEGREVEGKGLYNSEAKTLPGGSVNAPDHFHPAFTPRTLSAILTNAGLVDVHAEIKGRLPVFGVDAHQLPCLIVRGRKA